MTQTTPGSEAVAGSGAGTGREPELKRVMGSGLLLLFIVGDILGLVCTP